MKCPHCGETCLVPPYAEHNVETYRKAVNVVTECCGKLVRLSARTTFSVEAGSPDKTEDDWGTEVKGGE